jgi:hypothetical protein
MVETVIIVPVIVLLVFGVIEFASAYNDSSVVADSTRSGGRIGSAQAQNASFGTNIAGAVSSRLKAMPADQPKELWIYKANDKGYPGASGNTTFSTCTTNCMKYTWVVASKSFGYTSGTWSAASHNVCTEPFDQLGVYVTVNHKFVTGLFGTTMTLKDHSVFRFEPSPNC